MNPLLCVFRACLRHYTAAQLSGHTSSIVDVLVSEEEHQIVTLGLDKTVKVWDIRNHKCLQTFYDKNHYR